MVCGVQVLQLTQYVGIFIFYSKCHCQFSKWATPQCFHVPPGNCPPWLGITGVTKQKECQISWGYLIFFLFWMYFNSPAVRVSILTHYHIQAQRCMSKTGSFRPLKWHLPPRVNSDNSLGLITVELFSGHIFLHGMGSVIKIATLTNESNVCANRRLPPTSRSPRHLLVPPVCEGVAW